MRAGNWGTQAVTGGILAATLFSLLGISSPQAATFKVLDDEILLCVLSFGNSFQISAAQGGGIDSPIWVSLDGGGDVQFGKELRLEIDVNGMKPTYLGGVGEYSGQPEFEVPMSLLGELSRASGFTYTLDNQPSVVVRDGLTRDQVKEFQKCIMRTG